MAYTVQNMIDAALREIGALASGESPSAAESADALVKGNQLLKSWSAQALPIPKITRSVVALTGAASYALSTRPMKIKAASIVSSNTLNMQLKIDTPAEWAGYIERGTGDFGEHLFYEDGYPLGKIHIAPKCTGTLELISDKAVERGLIGVREAFAVTGAASYTIGVGGTFSTERPIKITGASILAGGTIAKGLEIVTAEMWAQYARKGVHGSFADVLWYDGGFPTGTVWLAPKVSAGSLELYTYEPFAAFTGLSQDISTLFPDGYERAIRAALAVELAPEYGRPLDAALSQQAEDAKTSVFGLNAATLGPPQGAVSQPPPAVPPQVMPQRTVPKE